MSQPSLFEYSSVAAGIPLSRYAELITRTVNSSPELFGAWIIAELSDVRVAGGHCYMELVEKNDRGQTIAKMRATIWQSTYSVLRRKFMQATQKDIATGIKVMVRGNASHHAVYGLSFNIIDIDPSYTLGDVERLRLEILQRLAKEGVVNLNKSRLLSPAPQKIAVISAAGAAGYGDFIDHLLPNPEGFVFYPCLFSCSMQGDRVSASIRHALKIIEETQHIWDCVAIIRGGGSTTDLNSFDDYELAKAVATFPLPIIVGIGHERDRNVLDEIAHTSLKTPTAVANFFIDKARETLESVVFIADKIRTICAEKMLGEQRRIASLESLIPQLSLMKLADNHSRLKTLADKLPILVAASLGRENTKLTGKWQMVSSFADNLVKAQNQKLINFQNLLQVLSPTNTLRRGYSVTRINGKAVKDISALQSGDVLTTQLFDGEVKSKVL